MRRAIVMRHLGRPSGAAFVHAQLCALAAAASFPSRAVTSAIQRRLDDHLCLECPAGECAR